MSSARDRRTRRGHSDEAAHPPTSGLSGILRLVHSASRGPGAAFLRPSDSPRARVSGHDTDRLLIVGSGLALGWGVATHGLALPGALARAVSTRTKRGSEVDLVADAELNAVRAVPALRDRDLSRYDAIVVVFGHDDVLGLTPARRWRAGMAGLLSFLLDAAPAGTEIIALGIPPIRLAPVVGALFGRGAEQHRRLLNHELATLCDETQQATFVPVPAGLPGGSRHPTAEQYTSCGGAIADRLVPLLAARFHPDGDRRHRGLHRLPPVNADQRPDPIRQSPDEKERLRRIMALAQQAFRVESARFTIVDHERQWNLSLTGTELVERHESALCEMDILHDGVLLVRDARDDERFADHPLVVGPPHIRFFAGFPIDAPDGSRIGALCVFDSQPRRRTDDIDLGSLRELAQAAQRELPRFIPVAVDVRGEPDAID